jgi:outer membrane biosynthesis protein TonB
VIAGVLDRSGSLKNLRVLSSDPGTGSARILAALSSWKFTPAQRGTEPVEVTVILGFNIDTRT